MASKISPSPIYLAFAIFNAILLISILAGGFFYVQQQQKVEGLQAISLAEQAEMLAQMRETTTQLEGELTQLLQQQENLLSGQDALRKVSEAPREDFRTYGLQIVQLQSELAESVSALKKQIVAQEEHIDEIYLDIEKGIGANRARIQNSFSNMETRLRMSENFIDLSFAEFTKMIKKATSSPIKGAVQPEQATPELSLEISGNELDDFGRFRTAEDGPYCFLGTPFILENKSNFKIKLDSLKIRMKAPFAWKRGNAVAPWYDERSHTYSDRYLAGSVRKQDSYRFAVDQASAKKLIADLATGQLREEFTRPQDVQIELYYFVDEHQNRSVKDTKSLPLSEDAIDCLLTISKGEFDKTFKYSYD